MWRITFTLFVLAAALMPTRQVAAQDVHKTVIFSVIDANTGKPVEGAEISFKMLLGKITKKTGSDGKASFDLYLAGVSSANYSYTIATAGKTHKTYTGTLTLLSSKDVYELSAALQSLSRKVSLSLTDADQKQLSNTEVRLKDMATNLELVSKTDANGIANFEIPAGASSGNFLLRINKQGFTELALPVAIDEQTSRVAVVAPLQQKELSADMDIPAPVPLPVPTTDYPTRSGVTVFKPTWGPYQPQCDPHPLAGMPSFSKAFVKDEETLLDKIYSSCFGSANDAVDSLIALSESLPQIVANIQDLYAGMTRPKNPTAVSTGLMKIKAEEDKGTRQLLNAKSQLSEVFEKMQAFAAGPELYAVNCLLDAIKKYNATEEKTKLRESKEAFEKAKTGVAEKIGQLNKPLNQLDRNVLLGWNDITNNIIKAAEFLNVVVSYYEDPAKLLPAKMQVSLAISAAEERMNNLLTDCRIIECDRQIKKGIIAATGLYTSALKRIAQQAKCESKYRQILNTYVQRFKEEDRDWEHYADNNPFKIMLPQDIYGSYVNCHNARIDAEKDSGQLYRQLVKLEGLCQKIQPVADVLNARVKKYEGLYNSGLMAVESCQLDEAALYINQLKAFENSECGHFYPQPMGMPKSAELNWAILDARQSGLCNKEKKVVTKKGEEQHGPFYVSSGAWLPTGITLQKGDYIRVQADSFFVTKTGSHIGPAGGGHWMWWTLAGEIGTQRLFLDNRGGEITGGGELKLGTPRGLGSKEFVKEDVENLQGNLRVYVFVKRRR